MGTIIRYCKKVLGEPTVASVELDDFQDLEEIVNSIKESGVEWLEVQPPLPLKPRDNA